MNSIPNETLLKKQNLTPTMIELVITLLPDGKREGDEWVAVNPTRDDKTPGSFKVNLVTGKWIDFATGEAGGDIVSLVGYLQGIPRKEATHRVSDWLERSSRRGTFSTDGPKEAIIVPDDSTATAQPETIATGCTLERYAESKRLSQKFLASLGLRNQKYQDTPALRIPYLDPSGHEVAVRYRTAVSKDAGGRRFLWKKGDKPCLYGLWRLEEVRRDGYVVLVEGESDCQTLWARDIPALGIPGATNWKENRDAPHLKGIETIYVMIEPDSGGEAMRKWLAGSSVRDRIRLVSLDGYADPSDLHVQNPDAFAEIWQAALERSETWIDIEDQTKAAERDEAWRLCEGLARDPHILDRFVVDLCRSGVVGEDRTAKLLYLALTSRFLSRPVSMAIKGPSSGGKSFVSQSVLRFFPPEAYYALTAMSEHALAYSKEPVSHRFLVIYEGEGMAGDFGNYLMRSLLSEGRIRYETVDKTGGELKGRVIEREGPTGLLVTTTKARLHAENETRLFSVTVTDTRNQTRLILKALASGRTVEIDYTEWHALQTWLAGAEHRVVIPYADTLAERIRPAGVRLRRDFGALLNLIESHAILHQANRERDSADRIVATREDYAVVRELVVDIIGEGVGTMVSVTVRETVAAVEDLICNRDEGSTGGMEWTPHFTFKQIGDRLGIDKSSAQRRVRVAQPYLVNEEDRKGRPARIVLGEPLPEDMEILPPPEVL